MTSFRNFRFPQKESSDVFAGYDEDMEALLKFNEGLNISKKKDKLSKQTV